MAKSENQKLKLLWLVKFLTEETDSLHPMTIAQMISRLDSVGISAERKASIPTSKPFGILGWILFPSRENPLATILQAAILSFRS